ncbi:hypothetical protein [Curtobacterium sp. 1544]|uniref:hypothetical protein n=1 Tax=Curtobacterium sp. 1544 TaxID=3156417 RepID=UPI00339967C7
MGAHKKTTEPIWFPWQRVIRTAGQVLVATSIVLTAVAVVAPQVLDAVADVLPGPWVAWLTGAIAFVAALAAALARVMALPVVNTWLTALGAGSVPASGHSAGTEPAPAESTTAGYPAANKTEPADALG